MTFSIELEREDDGRWLAEVPSLEGVMCYGADRDEAVARVQALALRTKHSAASQNETAADDHQENSERRGPRRQHDSQLLVEDAEPANTPPADEQGNRYAREAF